MPFVWTPTQHQQLLALCQQHGVEKLWVFGSAATGTFDPARSDQDLPPALAGGLKAASPNNKSGL